MRSRPPAFVGTRLGISYAAEKMKSQAAKLNELYEEVGEMDLFVHPIALTKRKTLVEKPKGLFQFKPLFRAIR